MGNAHYLAHSDSADLLRIRLGADISLQTLDYGEAIEHNGVRISLHPAGHILGSAQVRIEHGGDIWVYSGDYKTAVDPTSTPFELVRCNAFVTESTFGLPIYRWPPPQTVFEQINDWWRENRNQGKASVLFGYSLGKAQRILAGVDASIGPIFTHGAVEPFVQAYRDSGVALPSTTAVSAAVAETPWNEALILAPPSARGSTGTIGRFRTLSRDL